MWATLIDCKFLKRWRVIELMAFEKKMEGQVCTSGDCQVNIGEKFVSEVERLWEVKSVLKVMVLLGRIT